MILHNKVYLAMKYFFIIFAFFTPYIATHMREIMLSFSTHIFYDNNAQPIRISEYRH